MMGYDNEVIKHHTTCQNCGEPIIWSSDNKDDDKFDGGISKLAHHINYDAACLRIRKLKILNSEPTRYSQDHYYKHNILNIGELNKNWREHGLNEILDDFI